MSRPKGSKNNINYKVPPICQMSVEERLQIFANIIVDSIRADLAKDTNEEVIEDV